MAVQTESEISPEQIEQIKKENQATVQRGRDRLDRKRSQQVTEKTNNN